MKQQQHELANQLPDLDTLQRCLQHAPDMADYLRENGKAITDHMIDNLGDLPPELDDDEYRKIEQTLRPIERLQHNAVMRDCA